jgi:hypothetical protein
VARRREMTEEWRLSKPTDAEGLRWRIRDEGGQCIAEVYSESDARLMAVAQKMAKALMAAWAVMACHGCSMKTERVESCKAAECGDALAHRKADELVRAALLAAVEEI